MQIIGQKCNLDLIDKWENLPNFIIIQGDKNTGKKYLTKYICEKFDKSYVEMKNGINDVRELLNAMTENANVIYHFKDFDTASTQAKNALLKITEETPKGNYIIITGSHQIPTLESRAYKIIMSSYTKEEMLQFLNDVYKSNNIFDYYKAGFNTPSKVMLWADYEDLDSLLYYAYEIFDQLSVINISRVIKITSKFEAKYESQDKVVLFVDMLINIINYKVKNELKYRYSFQNVLDILIGYKELLTHNMTLNRKFILYRIFYDIMLLGGNL